jgi:predicted dehydrogenase
MDDPQKVRFAVVGLGNIAQMAVLPAFEHASESCELVALVSSDAEKLAELSQQYQVQHTGGYDDLDRIFRNANVQAAYIALPNAQHRAMTERCARAGAHVLCEKPMAMTVEDCEAMNAVCEGNGRKLMIAYRLHFDAATLRSIELAQSGKLGELRFFSSTFSHQVRAGNIRTRQDHGGGALFDMGIYCVNAVRNLFRDEPIEVLGSQVIGHDRRFGEVDEMTSAVLRFPGDRIAQLTCSQGAADVDEYRVVGTLGSLRVEPAYSYHDELTQHVCMGDKSAVHKFAKSDQFAPELAHFAECILSDTEPEPSGQEGLADVRVMQAIIQSARASRPVALPPMSRTRRPGTELEARQPPVSRPRVVHAPSPSR